MDANMATMDMENIEMTVTSLRNVLFFIVGLLACFFLQIIREAMCQWQNMFSKSKMAAKVAPRT